MKFIRYGILKAFDHPDWDDDPNDDHAPPRRYGFYAFPYAFHDAFYMVHKPASDPDSIMQYVRDERGRKITGRAIENYLKEYDLDGGVRARPAEGRSQAVPRPHTHAACAEPRHRRAAVHAADARHRPAQRGLPRRRGRQARHLMIADAQLTIRRFFD